MTTRGNQKRCFCLGKILTNGIQDKTCRSGPCAVIDNNKDITRKSHELSEAAFDGLFRDFRGILLALSVIFIIKLENGTEMLRCHLY